MSADSQTSPLLLRARVVYPVSRPPIDSGAIVISGKRILAVGRWKTLRKRYSGEVQDLGDVVLMPGLINAHCHLDYTHMAGMFPPQKSFCDWIKLITTEKAHWIYSDYAKSWMEGAKMLLRSGTTTVADIEAVPELLPDVWDATPLRVISFLEMTGVRKQRKPAVILREALDKIDSLTHDRSTASLSPHAPYSTPHGLLSHTAGAARRRKLRVVTHVAESATEFEMFTNASGEMFEWLKRNNRDMSDCGKLSPVQHLAKRRALGPHLIAVHVNYLADGDAQLLARHKTTVCHCPRSHDYFRHAPFPRAALARAGVNICLGTDSLATIRKHPRRDLDLSLFHEMRKFSTAHPTVSPEEIIRMVTMNPARALGFRSKLGEISKGAIADLIALPLTNRSPVASVLEHTGSVTASMISGKWAVPPNS